MKYYKMKAIKTFIRNGEVIARGEIVDCDKEAKNQMLKEELMELVEK